VGRSNGEALTAVLNADGSIQNDTNGDGVQQEGEDWTFTSTDQVSEFIVTNTYAVIVGQAQVTKSVTESWAIKDGVRIDIGDHGYNHTQTAVKYIFNALGQLTGATGRSVGAQNSEVYSVDLEEDGSIKGDTDKDGLKDVDEDINNNRLMNFGEDRDGDGRLSEAAEVWTYHLEDQRSSFETVNTYAVILGQAQVIRSVTTTRAVGADGNFIPQGEHGYSRSVTTVNYQYNNQGQLMAAQGQTVGTQNNKVKSVDLETDNTIKGDLDKDGRQDVDEDLNDNHVLDEGEDKDGDGALSEAAEVWTYHLEDQGSTFSTVNNYAVILGQAVVVSSVTTSDALDSNGDVIGAGAHGYSHSVSTVHYTHNALGQLTGAEGTTVGVQNSKVYSVDLNDDNSIKGDTDKDGRKDVDEDLNDNHILDAGEDVDKDGTLSESAEVWTYHLEDLGSVFTTVNTYVVIRGQAVVGKSVTTSQVLDVDGTLVAQGLPGFNQNVSTIQYTYNELGQLTGAVGGTQGVQTQAVYSVDLDGDNSIRGDTDKDGWKDVDEDLNDNHILDEGEDVDKDGRLSETAEVWTYHLELQGSETEAVNTYVIIKGQALVSQSRSKTWATDGNGVRIRSSSDHGYSFSETRMVYAYNDQGQMTGAKGFTTGSQSNEVLTASVFSNGSIAGDTDQDGRKDVDEDLNDNGLLDEGEDVDGDGRLSTSAERWMYRLEMKKSEFKTLSSYVIIKGQSVVSGSATETWALDHWGSRIALDKHGFNHTLTLTTYVYNSDAQLVDASGTTENFGAQEVLTSGDGPGPSGVSGPRPVGSNDTTEFPFFTLGEETAESAADTGNDSVATRETLVLANGDVVEQSVSINSDGSVQTESAITSLSGRSSVVSETVWTNPTTGKKFGNKTVEYEDGNVETSSFIEKTDGTTVSQGSKTLWNGETHLWTSVTSADGSVSTDTVITTRAGQIREVHEEKTWDAVRGVFVGTKSVVDEDGTVENSSYIERTDGSVSAEGTTTAWNGDVHVWTSSTASDGSTRKEITLTTRDGQTGEIVETSRWDADTKRHVGRKHVVWESGEVEDSQWFQMADGLVETRGTTTTWYGDVREWTATTQSDGSVRTETTITPSTGVTAFETNVTKWDKTAKKWTGTSARADEDGRLIDSSWTQLAGGLIETRGQTTHWNTNTETWVSRTQADGSIRTESTLKTWEGVEVQVVSVSKWDRVNKVYSGETHSVQEDGGVSDSTWTQVGSLISTEGKTTAWNGDVTDWVENTQEDGSFARTDVITTRAGHQTTRESSYHWDQEKGIYTGEGHDEGQDGHVTDYVWNQIEGALVEYRGETTHWNGDVQEYVWTNKADGSTQTDSVYTNRAGMQSNVTDVSRWDSNTQRWVGANHAESEDGTVSDSSWTQIEGGLTKRVGKTTAWNKDVYDWVQTTQEDGSVKIAYDVTTRAGIKIEIESQWTWDNVNQRYVSETHTEYEDGTRVDSTMKQVEGGLMETRDVIQYWSGAVQEQVNTQQEDGSWKSEGVTTDLAGQKSFVSGESKWDSNEKRYSGSYSVDYESGTVVDVEWYQVEDGLTESVSDIKHWNGDVQKAITKQKSDGSTRSESSYVFRSGMKMSCVSESRWDKTNKNWTGKDYQAREDGTTIEATWRQTEDNRYESIGKIKHWNGTVEDYVYSTQSDGSSRTKSVMTTREGLKIEQKSTSKWDRVNKRYAGEWHSTAQDGTVRDGTWKQLDEGLVESREKGTLWNGKTYEYVSVTQKDGSVRTTGVHTTSYGMKGRINATYRWDNTNKRYSGDSHYVWEDGTVTDYSWRQMEGGLREYRGKTTRWDGKVLNWVQTEKADGSQRRVTQMTDRAGMQGNRVQEWKWDTSTLRHTGTLTEQWEDGHSNAYTWKQVDGGLIEARGKVAWWWGDVQDYVWRTQTDGSIMQVGVQTDRGGQRKDVVTVWRWDHVNKRHTGESHEVWESGTVVDTVWKQTSGGLQEWKTRITWWTGDVEDRVRTSQLDGSYRDERTVTRTSGLRQSIVDVWKWDKNDKRYNGVENQNWSDGTVQNSTWQSGANGLVVSKGVTVSASGDKWEWTWTERLDGSRHKDATFTSATGAQAQIVEEYHWDQATIGYAGTSLITWSDGRVDRSAWRQTGIGIIDNRWTSTEANGNVSSGVTFSGRRADSSLSQQRSSGTNRYVYQDGTVVEISSTRLANRTIETRGKVTSVNGEVSTWVSVQALDGTIRTVTENLLKDGQKTVVESTLTTTPLTAGTSAIQFRDIASDVLDWQLEAETAKEAEATEATIQGTGQAWTAEVQRTLSKTKNSYAIIRGQAVIMGSMTVTYAVGSDGQKIPPSGSGHSESVTVTTYRYNSKAQLVGAEGRTTGAQTRSVNSVDMNEDNSIKGDTNQNGKEDDGEQWTYHQVDQSSVFSMESSYTVIRGQAVVAGSVTTTNVLGADGRAVPVGDHGYNHNVTRVAYAYNALGQMTGATGKSVVQSNMKVRTPKRGTDQKIIGDVNKDDRLDADETWEYTWANQPTVSEVSNTYGVVLGQAVVVKSVTESRAATLSRGTFTKIDSVSADGYTHSVTTVSYQYNKQGQMIGARGSGVTMANGKAWTADYEDVVENGKVTGRREVPGSGRYEDRLTHSESKNTYSIVDGQAVVTQSVTTTSAVRQDYRGRMVPIKDMENDRFSQTVTTVNYTYDGEGRLSGATGSGYALANTKVRTADYEDVVTDGVVTGKREIVHSGRYESHLTSSDIQNSYTIINGQAVVLESVTKSWAADVGANRTVTVHRGINDDRYAFTTSIVKYQYDSLARLMSATGTSRTEANMKVRTADYEDVVVNGQVTGRREKVGTERFETRLTVADSVNLYVVMNGQAVVVQSNTTSWAANVQAGKVTAITDQTNDRYSHTTSVVYNRYDTLGRLVGATGDSRSEGTSRVWTAEYEDVVQNGVVTGRREKARTGRYENRFSVTTTVNTYGVVNGQAVVLVARSESLSAELDADQQVVALTDVRDERYTQTRSTVISRHDSLARLVSADGYSVTKSTAKVWTSEWEEVTEDDKVIVREVAGSKRLMDKASVSETQNTYGVVNGLAVVLVSDTQSWTGVIQGNSILAQKNPNSENYSFTESLMVNTYDAQGRLVAATGYSRMEMNIQVWTSDLEEYMKVEDKTITTATSISTVRVQKKAVRVVPGTTRKMSRPTVTWTTNTYGVVGGQAVVIQSVSDSYNATASSSVSAMVGSARPSRRGFAAVTTPTHELYSHTTSTLLYTHDSGGRVIGAQGWSHADNASSVYTSDWETYTDAAGKKAYREVAGSRRLDQRLSVSDTRNVYGVINGQAVVLSSVTDTYSATENQGTYVAITDAQHGQYSHTRSLMFNSYDRSGRLESAVGRSQAWVTQEGIDGQSTIKNGFYTETTNTYSVMNGQSVVLRSVATTWAMRSVGERSAKRVVGEHNYAYTIAETNYRYDDMGRLTGASGFSRNWTTQDVLTQKDANGDVTVGASTRTWDDRANYSESTLDYAVVAGQAQVIRNVTESWAATLNNGVISAITDESVDQYNHQTTLTYSSYDRQGRLLKAWGTTEGSATGMVWFQNYKVEKGTDGKDHVVAVDGDGRWEKGKTLTTGTNVYRVIRGQSVLVENETVTTSYGLMSAANALDTARSRSVNTTRTLYHYDTLGRMTGAEGFYNGRSESPTHDGKVIIGVSEGTNTYAMVAGQAVITTAVGSTRSYSGYTNANQLDQTSANVNSQNTVTSYRYDSLGRLVSASGTLETRTENRNDDGTVTVTVGSGRNIFALVKGQAQVVKSITDTATYSGYDGSASAITRTNPPAGVASVSNNHSETFFRFDEEGHLIGATGTSRGSSNSWDIHGAVTRSTNSGTTELVVLNGQAQVVLASGRSTTTAGASVTVTDTATRNIYDEDGLLSDALGSSVGVVTVTNKDGTKSTTTSGSTLTHIVRWGVALASDVTSTSRTEGGPSTSETTSDKPNTVHYIYNQQGQMVGATGASHSTSTSSSYSSETGQYTEKTSTSDVVPVYIVMWGQALVSEQTTDSYEGEQGRDGSHTHLVVKNSYNEKAQLTGAEGTGYVDVWTQVPTDPDGVEGPIAVTYSTKAARQHMTQVYGVSFGSAVMTKNVTTSQFTNPDRSTEFSITPLVYTYTALGQLDTVSVDASHVHQGRTGAWSRSVSSVDKDGLTSTTYTNNAQTYRVIHGQSVLVKNISDSQTTGPKAGESNRTILTMNYRVDSYGRVTGASASGTQTGTSADDNGNTTDYTGTISQTYIIHEGQAVMTGSVSTSVTNDCDGGYCSGSTSTTTTRYVLDEDKRVVGGTSVTEILYTSSGNGGNKSESSTSSDYFGPGSVTHTEVSRKGKQRERHRHGDVGGLFWAD
jgi:hypothetical protein